MNKTQKFEIFFNDKKKHHDSEKKHHKHREEKKEKHREEKIEKHREEKIEKIEKFEKFEKNEVHKKHECHKKFQCDCTEEKKIYEPCFSPECQFTIHLDQGNEDYCEAGFNNFNINPFVGKETYYGVNAYEQYRGQISDSQFVCEREQAEEWLLTRFGINITGYLQIPNNGTINGITLTNGYIVTFTSDLSIGLQPIDSQLIGSQTITNLYYQPFVSAQKYCVSSSNCMCNKARVAFVEHRYIFETVDDVQYISYGFMQFYNKGTEVLGIPKDVYVYRYLYPLSLNNATNITDSQSQTNVELNISSWYGGSLAQVAKTRHESNNPCDLDFRGIYSFTVDNTYYNQTTNILQTSDGSCICNNDSQSGVLFGFTKTVNFIRNRLTGTVFFPGTSPLIKQRFEQLGLQEVLNPVNIILPNNVNANNIFS